MHILILIEHVCSQSKNYFIVHHMYQVILHTCHFGIKYFAYLPFWYRIFFHTKSQKIIPNKMTELIALLSEFGDLSPGSHIHIVTDQFNLETNFQPYFKIQTPNTFYKITNRSNILRKADYDDLPTISIQHIRASSILNMLVILVLSNPPEILDKSSNLPTTQVKKLSHAVNSGRNLLVPSIILRTEMFQGKQYFKGPFAIFWFTNWDPNDRFQFPRKSFFTR